MTRLLLIAVGCAVALLVFVGVGPLGASAQTGSGAGFETFDTAASADGVRIGVTLAGAPFTSQWVDLGGPAAQAVLNSLGKSQAYSAMPYPGDPLLTLPGFLAPLFGLPPPPGYPLIASSDASTAPKASVSQPGVSLNAKSEQYSSDAAATAGGSAVSDAAGTAAVKLDPDAGELSAKGTASADGVSIQGVLRIGHTTAAAEVVQPKDGHARATSSFTAEGVTIAGVSAAVTDKGILLPGSTTPTPDTSGLSPVLDHAGISVKYLAAAVNDADAVSAGLVVSATVPGAAGDYVVSYIFGRASAHAAGTASPSQNSPAVAAPTSAGPTSPSIAPPTVAAPTVGGAVTSAPLATSSLGRQPARSASATPAGRRIVATATSPISTSSFYLVLVVGALVMASGLYLVRVFGVRLAWT